MSTAAASSRGGVTEFRIGLVVVAVTGFLVHDLLTPDPRSVIGISIAPNWGELQLTAEGPLVDVMPTLNERNVGLDLFVKNRFEGKMSIQVHCADLELKPQDSEFNGQKVSLVRASPGRHTILIERINPETMVVYEDTVAIVNATCRNAMAYTRMGKRSVSFVLNTENILYSDVYFIADAMRITDVRTEYPWVRDQGVWTREPDDTSFSLDLTVYTVGPADTYQFDITRIDGAGAAELFLMVMATLLGVGVTLMTDGIRRMLEAAWSRVA